MEEVGKQYLKELVDRNLVFVKHLGRTGNIKDCYIHDAIRLLCLREAKKEKFLCIAMEMKGNVEVEESWSVNRILVVHPQASEVNYALQSTSTIRSLLCEGDKDPIPLHMPFKLLRVCNLLLGYDRFRWACSLEASYSSAIFRSSVNLRFLNFDTFGFYYDLSIFWNLQTLIVTNISNNSEILVNVPIWHMYRIRHIKVDRLVLPNPATVKMDNRDVGCVLRNVQTLCTLQDFKFSDEMVERIPDIKKLKLCYGCLSTKYNLNKLELFQKLESLSLSFAFRGFNKNAFRNEVHFPCSLKKLHLAWAYLEWEGIMSMIGSLPYLEVLKLEHFEGGQEWNMDGGEFPCLKLLKIRECLLKRWTVESTHFPCLEQLILDGLTSLEEIPSSIGDICTLNYIELRHCNKSTINSAQSILNEQAEFGNFDLKVRVNGLEKYVDLHVKDADEDESNDENKDEDENEDGHEDKDEDENEDGNENEDKDEAEEEDEDEKMKAY